VINYVTDTLNRASKAVFKNIIAQRDFLSSVRASLILFVILTAIGFTLGFIQITQKELIVRLFKIILITQLLTGDKVWDLLYNHFFAIFDKGVAEVTGIVLHSVTNGSISGLSFFDKMLNLFFSYETNAKIWSLLFYRPAFFIVFIFPFYTGLFYFLYTIAEALVFYLISYIFISLLILLAPIFLVFMLFNLTRSLYETWLKQLISYFIQPILVLAGVGLLGLTLINEMHRMLGFSVCWEGILKSGDFVFLYWWKPQIKISDNNMGQIPVPGFDYTNPVTNAICKPYECYANRYYDLPFLDPRRDIDLIRDFSSVNAGYNAIFTELCIFVILAFPEVAF
jgi:type IV secretion system protein VirB6